MKRILCLFSDGFEEIELVTPVDLLRRAGIVVVMASLREVIVRGRSGIRILADLQFDEVATGDFDLLLLVGGPAVVELRRDGRAAALASELHAAGKVIAAICAAPLILKDAGLLIGRNFTAHSSTLTELPAASVERVVIDGNLITAQGAGTAVEFSLKIIEHLLGVTAAVDVATAIMA